MRGIGEVGEGGELGEEEVEGCGVERGRGERGRSGGGGRRRGGEVVERGLVFAGRVRGRGRDRASDSQVLDVVCVLRVVRNGSEEARPRPFLVFRAILCEYEYVVVVWESKGAVFQTDEGVGEVGAERSREGRGVSEVGLGEEEDAVEEGRGQSQEGREGLLCHVCKYCR